MSPGNRRVIPSGDLSKKKNGLAQLSASSHAPNKNGKYNNLIFKAKHVYSQGRMTQVGNPHG